MNDSGRKEIKKGFITKPVKLKHQEKVENAGKKSESSHQRTLLLEGLIVKPMPPEENQSSSPKNRRAIRRSDDESHK